MLSHRRCMTDWFPGLIALAGSGQDAPFFTGPFWKQAAWCPNTHPQEVGSKCNLSFSVSLSVCLLCPSSLGPHTYTPVPFILKTSCLSLGSVMGVFVCGVVLSVQLLLLVFADIVGVVEHMTL